MRLDREGYIITIVTDAKVNRDVEGEKELWIKKHLPFLSCENVLLPRTNT